MTILDLLVCGLATNGAVEIWHHGSIFAGLRERLEKRFLLASENSLEEKLFQLLLCPFCLSFWVALFLVMLKVTGLPCLAYVLAVMRIANLLNDGFQAIRYNPPPSYRKARYETFGQEEKTTGPEDPSVGPPAGHPDPYDPGSLSN